jgi:exodeoxyribonuclease-3
MTLKLATWNINSVRLRRNLVAKLIEEHSPDVICLQEIKCRDAEFPGGMFRDLGYEHQAVHGQKGYHGVATLSRIPIAKDHRQNFCGIGDARHVSVSLVPEPGKTISLHNFYIPAGGDVPDREVNQKFGHKLDFLDELKGWISAAKLASEHAILVGDLNIAPFEHDVWNHKALLSVVSHTPVEVEKLTGALDAGPWYDAMRHFVPKEEKLYTWWSYRSPDWAAANKGRRLDHVWVSMNLAPKLRAMKVLKEARGWEQPSDHVPVIVEIDV